MSGRDFEFGNRRSRKWSENVFHGLSRNRVFHIIYATLNILCRQCSPEIDFFISSRPTLQVDGVVLSQLLQ